MLELEIDSLTVCLIVIWQNVYCIYHLDVKLMTWSQTKSGLTLVKLIEWK